MNVKRIHALVAAALLSGGTELARAADIGTAFTYQGYLEKPAGVPVDDLCDFRVNLYDVPVGGTAIGDSPQTMLDVSLTGGVFTFQPDFGPIGTFDGTARWLELDIRCTADAGFIPLTPRVELTPAPHAILADEAMRAVEEFRVDPGPGGEARIRFGNNPDNKCCITIDPSGPSGLNFSDPSGVRVIRPPAAPPGPTTLRFGPTDDCSIGIEPSLPGLVGRDPSGLRLMGDGMGGRRLLFGPTDDCSIGIANIGSSGEDGVSIRDIHGARIIRPSSAPPGSTQLRFGPTDDCSLGIDPTGPSGLVLRDPAGIRILNPDPLPGPARLIFGPTDDCSLGIDPALTGLVERDPIGFRLLGPGLGGTGCRLLFGPTDDCTISVDPPGGTTGLILRDPAGIRIVNPDPMPGPARLGFGNNPDNLCVISAGPGGPTGLNLSDPSGIRILNPSPLTEPTRLLFGPTDDCSLGIDPVMTGLVERDPIGLRLLSPGSGGGGSGGRILFGPTDDCSISVDPDGASGLRLGDPVGIRVLNPNPALPTRLLFGPTDDCSIGIEAAGGPSQGLCFSDPNGFSFKTGFLALGVPIATFRVELPNIATPAGQGFANAWINASSRRWKDNIQPIVDPLRTLDRLQGVSFVWKPEQGGKKDIGFIAEDVGLVLPEVVSWEKNGTDAKGVDYSRIVPVLVEALKEQQKQIESLDQQRGGVSARNRELEARLAALEAQVDRLLNQGKDGGR